MPQFIVTKGPDSGVAFSLADAPAKLGRNPDNSVVLHDESVSRAP
ncbi:MAG TPA: FHA domain-containing protein [Sumerlaeia bacterium]|nr:FHA domain-containing protein [Sumerlaeia bacterium]